MLDIKKNFLDLSLIFVRAIESRGLCMKGEGKVIKITSGSSVVMGIDL